MAASNDDILRAIQALDEKMTSRLDDIQADVTLIEALATRTAQRLSRLTSLFVGHRHKEDGSVSLPD